MDDLDYWTDSVAESFEEHEVEYDREKILAVAKDMSSAHEHYGQAFYQPPVSEHPVFAEIAELKKQLAIEKDKIVCPVCKGKGVETGPVGTAHSYITSCYKCNGEGRYTL